MHSDKQKSIWPYTLAVAMGFAPLGMTFGVLFNETGYPFYYAILMSIFIFAGSAQFLVIGLFINHASLYNIFLLVLILNSRHIFYSISMFSTYKKFPPKDRFWAHFTLIDETYSCLTHLSEKQREDKKTVLLISFLNMLWWVLSTSIGAVLGSVMDIRIPGLEFALTALFVVLMIEQLYNAEKKSIVIFGILAGLISLLIFRGDYFLISSILFSIVLFILWEHYGTRVHNK